MTYKINRTDGTLVTDLIDSAVDATSTDITLIGKNVPSYGEYINENFVRILENFASRKAPEHPSTGQLWYDTNNNRLKVYDGAGFKNTNSPLVSAMVPASLATGDLWFNSTTNQMYFYDGQELTLAGPIFSAEQGQTGFTTETVVGTDRKNHTIVKLWVANSLLGIFSSETTSFELRDATPGFVGKIGPGFNKSILEDIRFNTTALQAEGLLANDGTIKTPISFMSTEYNTGTVGTVTIANDNALKLGIGSEVEISSTSTALEIKNTQSGSDINVIVKRDAGLTPAITVDGLNQRVGIFNDAPTSSLSVTGSIKVTKDAEISSTISNSNSQDVKVSNEYVELNAGETNVGVSSDYAGLVVDRGLRPPVAMRWNEMFQRWETTTDGSTYSKIVTSSDIAAVALSGSYTDMRDIPQGGVWEETEGGIYYDGGQVGVKNAAPDALLDIDGSVKTLSTFEKAEVVVNGIIDLSQASVFALSVTDDIAMSVVNIPPAGPSKTFLLELENGGSKIVSWWENISWAGDALPPAFTEAGKDIIGFVSSNGGATWNAYLLGKDFKSGTLLNWTTILYDLITSTGSSLAVDSSNNVYTVSTLDSGFSTYNLLMTKFSSSGAIVWQKTFDAGVINRAVDIVVTPNKIYVTAITEGNSVTVFAIGSSGTGISWQRKLRSPTQVQNLSVRVAVDSASRVYVAQTVKNSTTGFDNLVVSQLTTVGAVNWAKVYKGEGTNSDVLGGISVINDNAIVLAGSTFVGSSYIPFVAMLSSTGTILWQQQWDQVPGSFKAKSLAVSSAAEDTIYVTSSSPDSNRISVVAATHAGVKKWSRIFENTAINSPASSTTNLAGSVILSGKLSNSSMFVAEVGKNGGVILQRQFSPIIHSDEGMAITVSTTGDINFVASISKGNLLSTLVVKFPSTGSKIGQYDIEADNVFSYTQVNLQTSLEVDTLADSRYRITTFSSTFTFENDTSVYVGLDGSRYYSVHGAVTGNTISFFKTTSNGVIVWFKTFEVPLNVAAGQTYIKLWAPAIVEYNNDVYITGEFWDSRYVDWLFIAKFDALGNNVWFKQLAEQFDPTVESNQYVYGYRLSVNDKGVFISTYVEYDWSTTEKDYGPVVKYSHNGEYLWMSKPGAEFGQYADGYGVVALGDYVYTTGELDDAASNAFTYLLKLNATTGEKISAKKFVAAAGEGGLAYNLYSNGTYLYSLARTFEGATGIGLAKVDQNLNLIDSVYSSAEYFDERMAVSDTGEVFFATAGSGVFITKLDSNLNVTSLISIKEANGQSLYPAYIVWTAGKLIITVQHNRSTIDTPLIFEIPDDGTLTGTFVGDAGYTYIIAVEDHSVVPIYNRTYTLVHAETFDHTPTFLSSDLAITLTSTSITSSNISLVDAGFSQVLIPIGTSYDHWMLTSIANSTTTSGSSAVTSAGQLVFIGEITYNSRPAQQLLKYNASGTNTNSCVLYHSSYSLSGGYITTDTSNNIIVAGRSDNTMNESDSFIVKFNGTLGLVWQKMLTGTVNDDIQRITTDPNDNIIAIGTHSGTSQFGYIVKYNSNGDTLWSRDVSVSGANNLYLLAVDTDTAGNIYAAGKSYSPNIGVVVKYSPTGTMLWARTFSNATFTSITVDSLSNVYLAGDDYSDTYTTTTLTVFVKLNVDGTVVWHKYIKPDGNDSFPEWLATDSNDNVYLIGDVYAANDDYVYICKFTPDGTREYGNVITNDDKHYIYSTTISINESSMFLSAFTSGNNNYYYPIHFKLPVNGSKLGTYNSAFTYNTMPQYEEFSYDLIDSMQEVTDDTGTLVTLGQPGLGNWFLTTLFTFNYYPSYYINYSVKIDALNNIYVAGHISNYMYLAKYSTTGVKIWGYRAGDPALGYFRDMVLTSEYIYVIGTNTSSTYFGVLSKYDLNGNQIWEVNLKDGAASVYGNAIAQNINGDLIVVGQFGTDLYVTAFDDAGTQKWIKSFYTSQTDEGTGVGCDSSGNVYVTGRENSSYISLIKLSSNGVLQWKRRAYTGSGDYSHKLRIDSSDNVYISGRLYSSMTYTMDALVIKYDTNGNALWSRVLGNNSSTDIGWDLHISPDNYIYLSGQGYINVNNDYGVAIIAKMDLNGNLVWQRYLGCHSSNNDIAFSLSTDFSGNIVIAGSIGLYNTNYGYRPFIAKLKTDGSNIGSWTIEGSFITLGEYNGLFATPTGLNHAASDLQYYTVDYPNSWMLRWTNATNYYTEDYAYGLASDSLKNIYWVGTIGTVYAGNYQASISKVTQSGNKLWARYFTVGVNTQARSVVVDKTDDSVYVAGASFDYNSNGSSNTPYNVFIIKFNAAGDTLWQKVFTSVTREITRGKLIIDSNKDVIYVTSGSSAGYIIKLTSAGTEVWNKLIAYTTKVDSTAMYLYGAAVDASDNIYVTGYWYNTTNYNNLGLLKLNAAGTILWEKLFGGNITLYGYDVTIDSAGNIITVGYDSSNSDCSIVKFDSAGAILWQRRFGGSNTHYAYAVATDIDNNIYITGQLYLSYNRIGIIKYDTNGNYLWSKVYGGTTSGDAGQAIMYDPDGFLTIGGNIYYSNFNREQVVLHLPSSGDGPTSLNTSLGTLSYVSTTGLTSTTTTYTQPVGVLTIPTAFDGWISGVHSKNGTGDFRSVAIGSDNSIYAVGFMWTDTNEKSVITKINADGKNEWLKVYGTSSNYSRAYSVVVDNTDSIYVGGFAIDSTGAKNGYVSKYDTAGNKAWTKHISYGATIVYGLAVATGGIILSAVGTSAIVIKMSFAGDIIWSTPLLERGAVEMMKIAVHTNGDIAIVGNYAYPGQGQDAFIIYMNSDGVMQWNKRIAASSNYEDKLSDVDFDAVGNIYAVGHSWYSNDYYDISLIKFDSLGNQIWHKHTLSTIYNYDYGRGIWVDTEIHVAAQISRNNTQPTYNDITYLAYDLDGNLLRKKTIGSNSTDDAYAVVATPTHVFVAGSVNGYNGQQGVVVKFPRQLDSVTTYIPYGSITMLYTSNTSASVSTASLPTSVAGSFVTSAPGIPGAWAATIILPNSDYFRHVTVDADGNAYIVGHESQYGYRILAKIAANRVVQWVVGTGNFVDIFNVTVDSAGNSIIVGQNGDGRILKVDPNGNTVWEQHFTGSGTTDYAYACTTDSENNIYVIGYVSANGFMLKINPAGTTLWKKTIADTARVEGKAVTLDSSGNIYVTGNVNYASGTKMFVAKFDSNGEKVWAKITSNTDSFGYSILVKTDGTIYAVGRTSSYGVLMKLANDGTTVWIKKIYGSSTTYVHSVNLGASSDIIITGRVYTNTWGSTIPFISSFSEDGTVRWTKGLNTRYSWNEYFGGTCSNTMVYISGQVTTESQPDAIMIALPIDGLGTGSYPVGKTLISYEAITLTYPANDTTLSDASNMATSFTADPENWCFHLPSTYSSFQDVVTDSAGNFYIAAMVNSEVVIIKVSPTGNLLWQRQLYLYYSTDYGRGIVLDSVGNVYVIGEQYTDYTHYRDILICKYDTNGSLIWQKRIYRTTYVEEYGRAICIKDDVLYLTGAVYNAVNSSSYYDIYTSKMSLNGDILWTSMMGVQGDYDYGYDIAVDSLGNVYVAGQTSSYAILVKYNSSGVVQWQKRLYGQSTTQSNGIVIDSADNIYVTGTTYYNAAYRELYVVKYDSTGTILWQKSFSAALYQDDYSYGITIDSSNNLWITGFLQSASKSFITKMDSSGTILMSRTISMFYSQRIRVTPSGKIVVVGYNYNNTYGQMYVLKADGSGTGIFFLGGNNFAYEVASLTVAANNMTASDVTLPVSTGTTTIVAASGTTSTSTYVMSTASIGQDPSSSIVVSTVTPSVYVRPTSTISTQLMDGISSINLLTLTDHVQIPYYSPVIYNGSTTSGLTLSPKQMTVTTYTGTLAKSPFGDPAKGIDPGTGPANNINITTSMSVTVSSVEIGATYQVVTNNYFTSVATPAISEGNTLINKTNSFTITTGNASSTTTEL